MTTANDPPLLEVEDLVVTYPPETGRGRPVQAVRGVSLVVPRGRAVGLVGESGSGKSTLGRALVRLVTPERGRIRFSGTELTLLSRADFFPYRRKMQMVFQDPYGSLNPRRTVSEIIAEPLRIHEPDTPPVQRKARVDQLLEAVGLETTMGNRLPHAFSGGQRQRIGIARALAVEPELLILDEPVSALDVSVQAQILNLLADLREQLNLSYLFIAHDLAVVEHLCDQVAVMYQGEVVESGPTEQVYRAPEHDYTRQLLAAAPVL